MKILPLLVLPLALVISSNSFAYTNYEKSHYYKYKVKTQYLSKVCFKPAANLPNQWRTALNNAINAYNTQFPIWMYKFHFAYAPYSTTISNNTCSYVVIVDWVNDETVYNPYKAVTTGCHSWIKKPCDKISVNKANVDEVYSSANRKGLLMHEMGHVIGMDHTGRGGNKIPNSHNDPSPQDSVMRGGGSDNIYGNDYYIPSVFTIYDVKSFRSLYGKW